MGGWESYALEDFLLFSPETYWRLFVLANEAAWPWQAAFAAALALALGAAPRLALALLGAAWLWSGWDFLWLRYAPINVAASYAAPLFWAQGTLLLMLALGGRPRRPGRVARTGGLALAAYAIALHPLTALAAGRGIASAEAVGLAPDPTAIASLGAGLALGLRWWAQLVPLAWCAASALVLSVLDAPLWWLPLAAAALALGLGVATRG